jgi:hypothetical protein
VDGALDVEGLQAVFDELQNEEVVDEESESGGSDSSSSEDNFEGDDLSSVTSSRMKRVRKRRVRRAKAKYLDTPKAHGPDDIPIRVLREAQWKERVVTFGRRGTLLKDPQHLTSAPSPGSPRSPGSPGSPWSPGSSPRDSPRSPRVGRAALVLPTLFLGEDARFVFKLRASELLQGVGVDPTR